LPLNSRSFLLKQEPNWLENRQGTRHVLPESVQSWTYEPGSLTQRLRDYYGNAVAVKLLFHRWRPPFLNERRLLQVPGQRWCLTREVLLQAHAKPLILARTIIPEQTIKGLHRDLSHLGTRPLGEVIFSYPKLERQQMDIVATEPNIWTQAAINLAGIHQTVWGRRTVYVIAEHAMLVSEFFLPEVLNL